MVQYITRLHDSADNTVCHKFTCLYEEVLNSGNYVHHGGPSLIVLCGFFLLVFSIVKYY